LTRKFSQKKAVEAFEGVHGFENDKKQHLRP